MARELAGGGRAVEVGPERLRGWFDRFAQRHGGVGSTRIERDRVEVRATDDSVAAVPVGFGGLPEPHGEWPGLAVSGLVEHVRRPRRIGLVLVRIGAHSVGVARAGKVERSSTDRPRVQGRTKAGGWSQQRYARRRQEQARHSLDDAADAIERVLVPERENLDAVVLGGDRRALEQLRQRAGERSHRASADLLDTAEPRVLDVPEPRRAVLERAALRAIAVEVEIHDTARGGPAS